MRLMQRRLVPVRVQRHVELVPRAADATPDWASSDLDRPTWDPELCARELYRNLHLLARLVPANAEEELAALATRAVDHVWARGEL